MSVLSKIISKILARLVYKIQNSGAYNVLLNAEKQRISSKFNKFGKNSRLPEIYYVKNPHYISIGDNFDSLHNLRIEAWDSYMEQKFYPEIIIGNDVHVNSDVHIGCINKVMIGNNVLMASRIYIADHSHGNISVDEVNLPPGHRKLYSKGPVIIEDNVWIGEGVCIMPGVTIGANSIIGANSVVTKNIPRNAVAGGVPAKILRYISNHTGD